MDRRAYVIFFLAAAIMVLLPACSKKQSKPESGLLGSVTGTSSGVRWIVPQRWQDQGQGGMRVATYRVAGAGGDTEQAECAVFYFGNNQGGGVDDNINRWAGQFEGAGAPVKSSKDLDGIKVTLVRIDGTYLAPGGPMMQSQGSKPNYRLLGAIVEAPEGPVFFKMTGPQQTVGAAEEEFNQMIGSVQKP